MTSRLARPHVEVKPLGELDVAPPQGEGGTAPTGAESQSCVRQAPGDAAALRPVSFNGDICTRRFGGEEIK